MREAGQMHSLSCWTTAGSTNWVACATGVYVGIVVVLVPTAQGIVFTADTGDNELVMPLQFMLVTMRAYDERCQSGKEFRTEHASQPCPAQGQLMDCVNHIKRT